MSLHFNKSRMVNLTSLIVRDRYLPPTETAIKEMMRSLTERGQIAPILVRGVTINGFRLIAGATRFEAAKRLGWKHLRADLVTVDDEVEYSIIEITENYARHDLTDEQRRAMKAKLVEYQSRLLNNVEPAKGGRGRKGGISEAARKAGIPESTARLRQKRRNNTKSCEVSADADTAPTAAAITTPAKADGESKLALRKISLDLTIGELDRLDAFWRKEGYEGRSACVRAIIRERVAPEAKEVARELIVEVAA
jgi:hypothetical protein